MTAGAAAPSMYPLPKTERKAHAGHIDLETRHRECAQCDGWLPFSAFGTSKNKPGGVSSTCKDCLRQSRRQQASEVWTKLATMLGGACHGCGIDVPVVLRLDPITPRGKMLHRHRSAGRSSATLARIILAAYADVGWRPSVSIKKDWRLMCANCLLRARHDDNDCPR